MKINWSNFTPQEFELFCAVLLEENSFRNILWHGESGGDRGRDLTATKQTAHLSSLSEESVWLIQCRRYTAKPPTKSEIHDWLVSCNEHKPDYCLLVVTNTLTSDTKDWLEQERKEFRFKIFVWEAIDLSREIVKRKRVLAPRFPQLYSTGTSVEFYGISQSDYQFGCNEFDEVGLYAYNCADENEAREKISDFLDFLKANDPFI